MNLFSTSAPGRLDVMGGIADYSGSLLLQMPIAERTTLAMQQRDDTVWNIASKDLNGDEQFFSFDFTAHKNISYTQLNKLLLQQHNGNWAVYVIGCFYVLQKEKQIPLTGAEIYITSQIPLGKGVSSSAAVEVATICAYLQMLHASLSEIQIPLLAQMAENFVVGAACGLMDQLSVYYGEANKLLPLICQPHTVMPAVEIPAGIGFCGIDSGIRHAVSGASYNDVRTAAFMGYSIIAQHCGASADEPGP